ncbi:ankyrin repeat domain-containing protein [Endozoicomonas atrinae]|uniref:ankyrin repeat domain-containing protein n=1 Tax=Endozoicomonas atrinae TaxID=1333660 RepID=UPI0008247A5D|nr:ankyrin repeat domain-containing protein [Endozoicomonas atrinae]
MIKDLLSAAASGDIKRIKKLLADGTDVNASGSSGSTPLLNAVNEGRVEVVRLLLKEYGARPEIPTLSFAASRGHTEIVDLLLEHGADVNAFDHTNYTALEMAVSGPGYLGVVRSLLNAGARADQIFDHTHFTPLRSATFIGDIDIIRTLLIHGADATMRSYGKRSALEDAIFHGHKQIVRLMLDHGVNIAKLYGTIEAGHLLKQAAYSGVSDIVKVLHDIGVKPDADTLSIACNAGHIEIAEYILGLGISPNVIDSGGTPAFHQAVFSGQSDVVSLMIKHKANLESLLDVGWGVDQLLEFSVRSGVVDVVGFLLSRKVDYDGSKLLSIACENGHAEVVRLLLDYDPGLVKLHGLTLLETAAEKGHFDVARILLEDHGVKPNPGGLAQCDSLVKAAHGGHDSVVRLLLSYLADFGVRQPAIQAAGVGHLRELMSQARLDMAGPFVFTSRLFGGESSKLNPERFNTVKETLENYIPKHEPETLKSCARGSIRSRLVENQANLEKPLSSNFGKLLDNYTMTAYLYGECNLNCVNACR